MDGVSFIALPGRVTSLIGPNGAGKTTVLNVLGGLYAPDAGAVMLGTSDVTGMPSYARARAGITHTYQTTQLFPPMSVLDNLLIALRWGKLGPPLAALIGTRCDAAHRQTAERLLAFVAYTGPLEQPAAALTHVDKLLEELARALASNCTCCYSTSQQLATGHGGITVVLTVPIIDTALYQTGSEHTRGRLRSRNVRLGRLMPTTSRVVS